MLVSELMKVLGTIHNTIHAYSHEENGICERVNKEVLRHLRPLVYHREVYEEWHMCLPMVQRILNTTQHSSTGFSPADLVYGGVLDLDRGIFPIARPPSLEHPVESLHEWVNKRTHYQQTLLSLAADNQRQRQEEHVARNSVTLEEYPIGTYVFGAIHSRWNREARTDQTSSSSSWSLSCGGS